jgi:hypothetical protein
MELLGFLIGGAVLLGPWVLAVVALVRANRAREEAERAWAEATRASLKAAEAWRAAREGSRAAPREEVHETVPAPAADRPAAPAEPPPPEATEATAPPGPARAAPAPGPLPPPFPAERPAPPPSLALEQLEEKIALVWLTRAGAVAVLLGAAYFLKYAIDNAWLGPWGRVSLSAAAGVAALVVGEVLRPRARAAWIHAVEGAGLALLFLAAFGSHALYHIVAAGPAFAAVAVVALVGGALAVRYRAELLLALAVAGGLLAPVLLSTGQDRALALFGYLLVLGGAAVAVSVHTGFRIVPWLALAGTAALAGGWYDRFFAVHPPPAIPSPSLPLGEQMGRYFPLSRRAIPLGAAVAFSAVWLAAHRRFRRGAPRLWSDGWLTAALLFAAVAPVALLPDRPILAGLVLAAVSVLAAVLLAEAERKEFVVAAAAVAFGLLALGAADTHGTDRRWIAAAALVAAAHLGVVARAWVLAGEPPTPARTGAAALAGLAFSGFAIALTGPREGVLRAALVGAAGVAELGLGAAVLARARAKGTVLLGAALALLAGAAAFLLSGASVTVAWAAMGAVAAVLGTRERDRLWIGGACVVLAAAILRAVAVDVPSVPLAASRFLGSMGAEGRLAPRLLLNPRAFALLALAVALLAAARAIARGMPDLRPVAASLAMAGWAAAVGLLVLEARDLALALPAPPAASDRAAWLAFARAVSDARLEQRGSLSAVTSLVLAVAAALLVGGGFVFRDAFHRWLGLGGFGLVLAKLVLSDVWSLSRLQQVAVLLGVGALLFGAAFLYARFGRRIAALLGAEPPGGKGGAALGLLLLVALPARALDLAPYRLAAPIEGVSAAGLHAFEADADLLRASRAAPGSLGDLRVVGPGGAEVPWALRLPPDPAERRQIPGVVVDSVVLPDGAVRALVDLGKVPPRRAALDLVVEGDEFLREVRLEISSDGKAYGILSEGQRVWAIRDLPGSRHTSVRHPVSEARWVRVTLLPGAGTPPRITAASAAVDEAAAAPLRALPVAVPAPRRSPDGKETLLDLDLGAEGLPVEAIELDGASEAYERQVRVLASADGAHWEAAGGGAIWRSPVAASRPDAAASGAASGARVPCSTGGRRWVRIAIVDGDSPPISVRDVRVRWRPREVVFRADGPGPYRLLVGAGVPAPSYDLAPLLARTGEASQPARAGRATANPSYREPVKEVPWTERNSAVLSAVLAAVLAALGVWAVRLLRRPGGGEGAP